MEGARPRVPLRRAYQSERSLSMRLSDGTFRRNGAFGGRTVARFLRHVLLFAAGAFHVHESAGAGEAQGAWADARQVDGTQQDVQLEQFACLGTAELKFFVGSPKDIGAAFFPFRAANAFFSGDEFGAAEGTASPLRRVHAGGDSAAYKLAGVVGNVPHKGFGGVGSALDAMEFFFPLTGHFGRLEEVVLQEGNEEAAHVGGEDGFLFAPDVVSSQQGFDDGGAGGRCSDAAFFEGLAQCFVFHEFSGRLHGGKEGIFGVVFRGFGFALAYGRFVGALLTGGEGGQFLIILFLFLGRGEEDGPAGLKNDGTLGLKGYAVALAIHGGDFFFTVGIEGGDELDENGVVDLLCALIEGARRDAGGDDGVVIFHFFVVGDAFGKGEMFEIECGDGLGMKGGEVVQDAGDARLDVGGDVARIGSGIGDDLLFVEALGNGKGLGGGEVVAAVHVALKSGEVIKLRGAIGFFRAFDGSDDERLPLNAGEFFVGLGGIGKTFAGIFEEGLAVDRGEFPEGLRVEEVDFVVALDDEREDGRLDAPEAPKHSVATAGGAVAYGVAAGGVEADDPVGFTAAAGGGVEGVVVVSVAQTGEGVAYGFGGEGVEPEASEGFVFVSGEIGEIAEDEFALAPGIGCADDVVGLAQQALNDFELFFDAPVLNEFESEGFGNEGEGLQVPALELGGVVAGFEQGDEMSKSPGHGTAPAFEVAIAFGLDAPYGGDVTRHGGLLCYDQFHVSEIRLLV